MIDFKKCLMLLITVSVSKSADIVKIEEFDLEYNNTKYRVPAISGIFTVASSNGLITEDLFYGYNTEKYHSLADEVCHYSVNINGEVFGNYENVNLVLEGVDLFSTIIINGKTLATTSNMFVKYVINIPKEIQQKGNIIELILTSPLKEAKRLHEEREGLYVIHPTCPASELHGDCYVNLIRKMQASFSSEWCPSVPSIGIWKPVYIEVYNESVIRDVTTHVLGNNDTHWKVLIDIYFAENQRESVSGRIKIDMLGKEHPMNMKIIPNKYNEFIYSTSLEIEKSMVELWWPNGYGSQPLYDLNILFSNDDETSSKTVRVGFRTIELIQNPLANGRTFYFNVNNLPIFMKGANLVPIDIRPELGQDKQKVRDLLTIARDQHMNMIRICGGGVYESDFLYDLADEYGILIWQNFMFTGSLYPSDETFLSNVLDEVRTQVKRIYHHPSLALFTGNNEIEFLLMSKSWNVSVIPYHEDYKKLFVDTIKAEYLRLTHNLGIYLTSSPSNGRKSEDSQYGLSKNPESASYGDGHRYRYTQNIFDSSGYPISRFTSEYGAQSLPCAESFLKDTNDEMDLGLDSKFMDFRQHRAGRNRILMYLIELNLALPGKNSKHYNRTIIYYSQIFQAMSMKIETELLRSYRTISKENRKPGHGERKSMGAIYWHFNDVWTAPSWSGIDFYGRWKMLQYFVYDFFYPIIIMGELTTVDNMKILKVCVVTDVDSIEGAEASIQLYSYSSLESIYEEKIPVYLEKGSSAIIHTIKDVGKYTEDHECDVLSCFVHVKLGKKGQQLAPDNYILLDKPKNCQLPQPDVQIVSIKKGLRNIYIIDVRTNMVALFVWLDAHKIDGRFSENGFLQVQAIKRVIFYCDAEVKDDEMKGNLTVTHLRDKMHFETIL